MDVTQERYYKVNRIASKILGLWPYQQSNFKLVQKVFVTSVILSFIIVQLLVFVTAEYNMELLVKVFSIVLPTVAVLIMYFLLLIQKNTVKRLLDQIRDDWNSLKNKLEIDIVKKYANTIWYFVIFVIMMFFGGTIICATLQHLPIILDVISPLNESRPRRLLIMAEYFIDQETYFYCLLMHEILCGGVVIFTLYSTLLPLLIFMQHGCVLFQITRYRLENVITESALTFPNPKREHLFYQKIVHAIISHRKAIEFVEYLKSHFMDMYIILILVGISSLILNLFQFLQIITLTKDFDDAIIFGLVIFAHLVYLFFFNYGGQQLIDHAAILSNATYNALWYVAPSRTQKLLLFIMQTGLRKVALTSCGLFTASIEGFATLLSTTLSYFTVLYSKRE